MASRGNQRCANCRLSAHSFPIVVYRWKWIYIGLYTNPEFAGGIAQSAQTNERDLLSCSDAT